MSDSLGRCHCHSGARLGPIPDWAIPTESRPDPTDSAAHTALFALRTRLGPDWEIPTGQLEITTGARLGRLARLGIPTGARLEKSRLGKIPTGESRLGPNPDWARLGNPDWVPTGPAPRPQLGTKCEHTRLGNPDWEMACLQSHRLLQSETAEAQSGLSRTA